ncbi:LysR family transcriptional regulator [Streptomyces sennicomposti]
MLDVRKLVLLREVEARGSIAAAAEALNYTRSAVSQQLSALEAETGTELVDRGSRRACLTVAGRLLAGHTERVLADLEAAEAELQAIGGRVSGELRVGVPFHEGPALMVPVLTRVRREHPDLRITLQGLPSGRARTAVRLGQVDLVLAVRYDQVPEPSVPGLHEEPLAVDRVRLVTAVGDGRDEIPDGEPGARPPALADFADRPWILADGSGLRDVVLHACAAAGFVPDVVARTGDAQAVLGLVSCGWGVSLMPDLVPERAGYPVRRIALDGLRLRRHLSLVVRRGTLKRPAVAAVMAAVRAAVDLLPGRCADGEREPDGGDGSVRDGCPDC